MASINLVRQDAALSQEQRDVMRATLFGFVDGLGEHDRKAWRRFWTWITKREPGEVFAVETWAPRHGGYHRRHMLIESRVFRAQERIATFEQFRSWLKVGAGFVDWMAGPKGGVIPIPRSISYRKADEDVMRQFHEDAMAFLRGPHAPRFLWPHLDAQKAGAMMDATLAEFDE